MYQSYWDLISLSGCRTKFCGNSTKLLDLTKNGTIRLCPVLDEDLKSVRIIGMNGMQVDSFKQQRERNKDDGDQWIVQIKVKVNVQLPTIQCTTVRTTLIGLIATV